jgi:rhodanese-related sulfurtransferase
MASCIRASLLAGLVTWGLSPALALAEAFPLRATFPSVQTISTEDLFKSFRESVVVDVRDAFEYEIMHIAGSKSVPVAERGFGEDLAKVAKTDRNPKLVFYCNGHTCAKSYEAAKKASELGYPRTFCYDDGILAWGKAHPEQAVLLGKSPIDPTKLIPATEFDKHLLAASDFVKRAQGDDALLIDARDPMQRAKTPDFGAKKAASYYFNKLVPLLRQSSFKATAKGKTLYIYDAAGKQVRWLQYLLDAEGYQAYYFLKDGTWSIFGEDGVK